MTRKPWKFIVFKFWLIHFIYSQYIFHFIAWCFCFCRNSYCASLVAFLEKKGRQLSCRFYHCSTKWNSLKQFMRKYFSVDKHEVVIFVKRKRKFLLVSLWLVVSLCIVKKLERVIWKWQLSNWKILNNNMINSFDSPLVCVSTTDWKNPYTCRINKESNQNLSIRECYINLLM